MTLTKTKPRPISAHHRKRSAQHHRHSEHYRKAYWPYLPIVAIITLGLICNSWYASTRHSVLGYAVDMSTSSLVSGTNSQRAANGLGSLALNSMLSQAAQTKANDMATRDYWSHNTPDGKTPWTFITATGYSYQSAGENLAYGFDTASETITGWMNSPEHRANLLGSGFNEVGFGVANAANYQGTGPQTIIVAMYAQPYTPAPAPVPAATSPAPKAVATAPITQQTNAQPASEVTGGSEGSAAEQSAGGFTDSTPTLPKNATQQGDSAAETRSADTIPSQDVSRLKLMGTTNVAWTQFAVSMLASVALLAFLLRHSFAWHKVLVKGEKFIVHHPLLDIVFVTVATLGYILLQTSGVIR